MSEPTSTIERNILGYIESLTVPNEQFGGWAICPFAKKALSGKQYKILIADTDLYGETKKVADDFLSHGVELVILCSTRLDLFDPKSIHDFVTKTRDDYKKKDIYMLYDHVAMPEYINGVKVSNGHYALMIVQEYSRLEKAAKQLHKAGYYFHWQQSPEELARTDTSFFFKEVWPKLTPT